MRIVAGDDVSVAEYRRKPVEDFQIIYAWSIQDGLAGRAQGMPLHTLAILRKGDIDLVSKEYDNSDFMSERSRDALELLQSLRAGVMQEFTGIKNRSGILFQLILEPLQRFLRVFRVRIVGIQKPGDPCRIA